MAEFATHMTRQSWLSGFPMRMDFELFVIRFGK
jgi:hypothetical protein